MFVCDIIHTKKKKITCRTHTMKGKGMHKLCN